MKMRHCFVYLILLALSRHVSSYNILAIASMPFSTHYMAFKSLFPALAARGHSVTVINSFPNETVDPNLKYVVLKNPHHLHEITLQTYETIDSSLLHFYNIHRHFTREPVIRRDCDNLFSNEEVKDLLKIKYDVIFVEQFTSDCALAMAGAFNDAPIIGIASHVLLPWIYPRLGIPFNPSSDSFYFTDSAPNPPLLQKVEVFLAHHLFNSLGLWVNHRPIYESFRRHFPGQEIDVDRIGKERMRMMFSYQHFSFTGARLLAPQLLEIGGLHIAKPKPVPEDIEKFLNGAEHGAVYVSLGTNLQTSRMSKKKFEQFVEAFRQVRPLKVLLKWENGSLHDENVFASDWFPQLDVLCHPKVTAFVSHGGMLGLSEAVSCGVPVVALPFYGDQFGNVATVKAAGIGTTLYLDGLTGDNLARAIKEITLDIYQEKAKEIAALWHDRPMSAMESAIYWTEYVARHPNAPPPLPTRNASSFEIISLDVYSILVCLLVLLFFLVYLVYKIFNFFIVSVLRIIGLSKKVKRD